MNVSYQPTPEINDFHNSGPITVRVNTISWGHDSEVYLISKRQAKRIENHFCGIADCRCAGGCIQQLDPEGATFGIPVKFCE